jgi:hypothetical protein
MSSLAEIKARWDAKYGVLPLAEREALIRKETAEGLQRIQEKGIVPTMTADELMKLTRER